MVRSEIKTIELENRWCKRPDSFCTATLLDAVLYRATERFLLYLFYFSTVHDRNKVLPFAALGSFRQIVNGKKPLEISGTVYIRPLIGVHCYTYLKWFFAIYYLPQTTK